MNALSRAPLQAARVLWITDVACLLHFLRNPRSLYLPGKHSGALNDSSMISDLALLHL